jgi:dTDP-4-dehydrorhamnose reductase
MSTPTILVTGANGQVGKEIKSLSGRYPQFHFLFLSKQDLPIHHFELLSNYFDTVKPACCINCAAYTAVDRAETEKEAAMLVNGASVGVLASVCQLFKTKFIHISTDYVFDGTAAIPYTEEDKTNPVNYYGDTKLEGEKLCMTNNPGTIIIRTSWVYSVFGNNFVKTMLRLMKERDNINVVNDQLGSPTYAFDLAKLMLDILAKSEEEISSWQPGIYHYSNEGIISWFDFAVAIKELTGSTCMVNPIPASAYPTPAKRPAYSALNKEKIKLVYRPLIPGWKESLSLCVARLQDPEFSS